MNARRLLLVMIRYTDSSSQKTAMLSRKTCLWYTRLSGEKENRIIARIPMERLPLR